MYFRNGHRELASDHNSNPLPRGHPRFVFALERFVKAERYQDTRLGIFVKICSLLFEKHEVWRGPFPCRCLEELGDMNR